MDNSSHTRGWLWFFSLLVLLTVAGIVLEIWFNELQRLKHGDLSKAEMIWREHRPAEYEMSYTVQTRDSDPELYVVRVRQSGCFQVIHPGTDAEVEEKLAAGSVPYLSLEDLFQRIDDQLTEDAEPGMPSVFATASFGKDGHIVRYVRSVRTTRERLEVNVKEIHSLAS